MRSFSTKMKERTTKLQDQIIQNSETFVEDDTKLWTGLWTVSFCYEMKDDVCLNILVVCLTFYDCFLTKTKDHYGQGLTAIEITGKVRVWFRHNFLQAWENEFLYTGVSKSVSQSTLGEAADSRARTGRVNSHNRFEIVTRRLKNTPHFCL